MSLITHVIDSYNFSLQSPINWIVSSTFSLLQSIINSIVSYTFNSFTPKIIFAKKFKEAIDPKHREDGSLGFDFFLPETIEFKPNERKIVNTGIICEFPSYLGMFIWDKSSVASKLKISVCGGVIDPGYRGCICIILQNCLSKRIAIPKGTAIAQAVFHLAIRPTFTAVHESEISESVRGERGFGGETFQNETLCPKFPEIPLE